MELTRALSIVRQAGLSVLLIAGHAAGAAPPEAAQSSGERVVPTSMCGSFFLVRLVMTGGENERSLTFVFDTGAARTVVDPDSIERVSGRRFEPETRINLRALKAGPLTFNALPADTMELDHIAFGLGHPIDGILGYPAMKQVLLTLDYPQGEMRVEKGSLPQPDGIEVFGLARNIRPFLPIRVGSERFGILIDSGASSAFVVRSNRSLQWAVAPRPAGASVRIDRLELRRAGRLAGEVLFGSSRFVEPIVELTDGTELLGARVLQHFVVTFDQQNRRVRIRRPGDAGRSIELEPVRGLGAALMPTSRGLDVREVFDPSPARDAGLRKGDLIVRINGRQVPREDCRTAGLQQSGAQQLSVRRGGESLEIAVRPAVLVP